MEGIAGHRALCIDAQTLARRVAGYDEVELDVGTGDGRYVRAVALAHPERFALGVDACRENLRELSRRELPNALYLIASAPALPSELDGVASRLTVNFPWGSLLDGLLHAESGLPRRLATLAREGAEVVIRLNAGALAEVGETLDGGAGRVRRALLQAGFEVGRVVALSPAELRALPTTWAHRLAFGRDPRALELRAVKKSELTTVHAEVAERMRSRRSEVHHGGHRDRGDDTEEEVDCRRVGDARRYGA